MPRKKPVAVSVAPEVSQAMIAYAAEHGLLLPDLVTRMWQLWMTIDHAHGTLYPHHLADGHQDDELEQFLDEMQAQTDEGPRPRDRQTGRFVAASRSDEDERKEVIARLNDIDVEQH